jgi:hypothetical protein
LLFGSVYTMHTIKLNKAFYEIQWIRNIDINTKPVLI